MIKFKLGIRSRGLKNQDHLDSWIFKQVYEYDYIGKFRDDNNFVDNISETLINISSKLNVLCFIHWLWVFRVETKSK